MKTKNLSELNDFEIKVIRFPTPDGGDPNVCTKMAVHVTFWTNDPGNYLKFVKLKNVKKKEAVRLKLDLKNDGEPCDTKLLFPIVFLKVFDSKEIPFEFKSEGNDILIVSIDIGTNQRPTGTKRKVITYEDTDIIDEGVLVK